MLKITWKYIYDNRYLFGKYATAGFIAAVIDFSILFVLTDFVGLHYLVSASISFMFAATVNYWINRHWTFKSSGKRRKQLPVFFTIAILGLILNNNIIYMSVEQFKLHYLLGKLLAAAIVTFWNFFGNKYLTFRIK
ncbi:MAG: GtrA family protein [Candidatus Komeilibacteria bacterium]|jgi:putative flippase GtrA|nr:GtrA family protein [Candidatus Komeilibacteria bacterium]